MPDNPHRPMREFVERHLKPKALDPVRVIGSAAGLTDWSSAPASRDENAGTATSARRRPHDR